jgi:hypothetical protein
MRSEHTCHISILSSTRRLVFLTILRCDSQQSARKPRTCVVSTIRAATRHVTAPGLSWFIWTDLWYSSVGSSAGGRPSLAESGLHKPLAYCCIFSLESGVVALACNPPRPLCSRIFSGRMGFVDRATWRIPRSSAAAGVGRKAHLLVILDLAGLFGGQLFLKECCVYTSS